MQYLSVLVRRCVMLVGLRDAIIDDLLLNIFEGVKHIASIEIELRRYVCVNKINDLIWLHLMDLI